MVSAVNEHRSIIQAGGTSMLPMEVPKMVIAPAERYDVLVTADQPCGNYTIFWHTHAEDEQHRPRKRSCYRPHTQPVRPPPLACRLRPPLRLHRRLQ